MPILITANKYSGSISSLSSPTRLIQSESNFVQSDFNTPRRVDLYNSTTTVYKGCAFVWRWVSTSQLALETPFFDKDGNTVTQAVGDTFQVSVNFSECQTAGLAVSDFGVTLTDVITFGSDNQIASCCFHDESKRITATINPGNSSVFLFAGGGVSFGRVDSYVDRTVYNGCNLEVIEASQDPVRCTSTAARLYWFGGSILVKNFPTRIGGDSAGTFQIWMGVLTNTDFVSTSAGANWNANPLDQRVINLTSIATGLWAICLRWGNGYVEGGTFKLRGDCISVFGSDSNGTFAIEAPPGRFISADVGTAARSVLWRSNDNLQAINYKNVIAANRRHGNNLNPSTDAAIYNTATFDFWGTYTNLQTGTLSIAKGDNLISTVVDSNTVGANRTSTLIVREAVVVGFTETVQESRWRVGFLRYGFDIVSNLVTTETINLGETGNAKRVVLGGFVGQTIDTDISVSNSAIVAAYTSIATLDQLYDAAQLWKAQSVTNALYPTLETKVISANGSTLSTGTSNLRIDTGAIDDFEINTSTQLITIKPNNLTIGTKFNTLAIEAGRTITFAQNGTYSFNLSVSSSSIINFETGGIATLNGTFALGSQITVATGQTLIVNVPTSQLSNITAGTGVTIQSPPYRFFGFPTVTNSNPVIRIERVSNGVVTSPVVSNGEAFAALIPGENYRVRASAKGFAPSRIFTINTNTSSSFQFDLQQYLDSDGNSVYNQGSVSQAARITFDPVQMSLNIFADANSPPLAIADATRAIGDLLNNVDALAFTAIPEYRNGEILFPRDSVTNAPNPASIKPSNNATADPILNFIVRDAANPSRPDRLFRVNSTNNLVCRYPLTLNLAVSTGTVTATVDPQIVRNALSLNSTASIIDPNSIDARLNAVKTKTDALSFVAGKVDATTSVDTTLLAKEATVNLVKSTVENIPVNPLRTNDARLNNLDAAISSRSAHSVADIWNYIGAISTNILAQILTRIESTGVLAKKANTDAIDTVVQSVKTKTDSLVVTSGRVDANINTTLLAKEATLNTVKTQVDLIPTTQVDVSALALQSTLQSVKTKTDSLVFTSGKIDANIDTTLILNNLAAIKSKTDTLSFISGSVVATAINVDLTPIAKETTSLNIANYLATIPNNPLRANDIRFNNLVAMTNEIHDINGLKVGETVTVSQISRETSTGITQTIVENPDGSKKMERIS